MPRTYELHLTWGEMETLKAVVEERRDACVRILALEGDKAPPESMKASYQLDIERCEGILDQI